MTINIDLTTELYGPVWDEENVQPLTPRELVTGYSQSLGKDFQWFDLDSAVNDYLDQVYTDLIKPTNAQLSDDGCSATIEAAEVNKFLNLLKKAKAIDIDDIIIINQNNDEVVVTPSGGVYNDDNFDKLVDAMDENDITEQILTPCTRQQYCDEYAQIYKEKHNSTWPEYAE